MQENKKTYVTKEELIREPQCLCPHVVLLGAGASRAAFPTGDALGKRLPIMNDIIDLRLLLERFGIDSSGNFETIYSQLTNNELKKN